MIIREGTKEKVCGPADVARLFMQILELEDETDKGKEHWWTMGTNCKNRVEYIELVGLGVSISCPVRAKETFRLAVMKNAECIFCVHNHPSGETAPSPDDDRVMKMIKEAGEILGIKLIDSIIIGDGDFYSYNNRGRL